MKIEIVEKEKPFSHSSGYFVMIPKTLWKVQVFPSALLIRNDVTGCHKDLFLNLEGPVEPFTVEQDLQEGCVRVFGQAKQGYFRYSLQKQEDALVLLFEKTPPLGICLEGVKTTFFKGDTFEVAEGLPSFEMPFKSQLFLGSSKAQDCDLIRRRKDLREVLPLWYTLGRLSPEIEELSSPVLDLFLSAEQAVENQESKLAYELLFQLYLTGFSAGLVPRPCDEEFQGIISNASSSSTAYSLLQRGSTLIRSLFFQEKGSAFHILPCLPSQFVCGKLMGIVSKNGSVFHLEWTKHRLRRICIEVKEDICMQLVFPSDVQSYRLHLSSKGRGRMLQRGETFEAKAGQRLWLDLFQK